VIARLRFGLVLAALYLNLAATISAQTFTYRGFADLRGAAYPADAPHDSQNIVADLQVRGELFARPVPWLGLAVGVDGRANSYDQVDDRWQPDIGDRGALRPRVSVRRLSATVSRGPLTVDVGKQFIRWGKADILTPTDRFAPRDFMNVIDTDLLAVRGVRAVYATDATSVDAVWVPFFTPSRLPLLNQRWTVPPPGVELMSPGAEAETSDLPGRSQAGLRWSYTGGRLEYSVSFFDGLNHLPQFVPVVRQPPDSSGGPLVVELHKRHPALRTYGGDAAWPTALVTIKGEVALFTTSSPATDEYVLWVLQLERQSGEWLFVGGYAGEAVTRKNGASSFAPDRGTARTILGRASYTIDSNRSAALEGAVRQDGGGLYLKGEYSQARGQHWRTTATAVLIRGRPEDFLGQFRHNSHVTLGLRYSF
jgi:hypothetical protein